MTHYLPYFTQYLFHQQRAACGLFIEETDHSPEPSCPQCLAWIQWDPAEHEEPRAAWEVAAAKKARA